MYTRGAHIRFFGINLSHCLYFLNYKDGTKYPISCKAYKTHDFYLQGSLHALIFTTCVHAIIYVGPFSSPYQGEIGGCVSTFMLLIH